MVKGRKIKSDEIDEIIEEDDIIIENNEGLERKFMERI